MWRHSWHTETQRLLLYFLVPSIISSCFASIPRLAGASFHFGRCPKSWLIAVSIFSVLKAGKTHFQFVFFMFLTWAIGSAMKSTKKGGHAQHCHISTLQFFPLFLFTTIIWGVRALEISSAEHRAEDEIRQIRPEFFFFVGVRRS